MTADLLSPLVRPYLPSWFDRFKSRLERGALPAWVSYLVLGLIPVPFILASDVAAAAFPLSAIVPFHVFLAVLPAATLWFMHQLDRIAERALEQAAPALRVTTQEEELLRYLLTTMPAFPALIATIAGALTVVPVYLAISTVDRQGLLITSFGIAQTPVSLGMFVVLIGLSYATGFLFLFHAFRQLRLIRRIYEHDVVVDLTELGPLYAFSKVSALTAVGIQVQAALWIVTNPAAGTAFLPVVFLVALTVVAAVIFILPLWGIHRRIADERAIQLRDNARTRQSLLGDLHRDTAADEFQRVTAIKDAVLALEVEARALTAVRTWPWEPETLRLLLTAVLLPTALFVVQYVVARMLEA